MKLTIACLFVASAIIQQIDGRATQDQANKFAPEETCVTEMHLHLDRGVHDHVTPEDNVLYGKFFVCVWKKRGVMDDEGNIDPKGFRRFIEMLSQVNVPLSSARINYVVKKCSTVIGDTPGQTGIKLKNCMAQAVSEVID